MAQSSLTVHVNGVDHLNQAIMHVISQAPPFLFLRDLETLGQCARCFLRLVALTDLLYGGPQLLPALAQRLLRSQKPERFRAQQLPAFPLRVLYLRAPVKFWLKPARIVTRPL